MNFLLGLGRTKSPAELVKSVEKQLGLLLEVRRQRAAR
jgi:hypothetical protein